MVEAGAEHDHAAHRVANREERRVRVTPLHVLNRIETLLTRFAQIWLIKIHC